jgi:hypothetical protein
VLTAQFVIAAAALLTVPFSDGTLLYVAAAVTLMLTALWVWLSYQLASSRAHAERLRRTTLIAGGLGIQLSGTEVIELLSDGNTSDEKAAELADPAYFASDAPPGPLRLAAMLNESANFTVVLAGMAAKESWLFFLVGLVITAAVVMVAVGLEDPTAATVAARMAFTAAAVLLTQDFLGAAIGYSRARAGIRRTLDRLEPQLSGQPSLERLMMLFGEYNAAVETMPLFRNGLFLNNASWLNEKYRLFLTGPQP